MLHILFLHDSAGGMTLDGNPMHGCLIVFFILGDVDTDNLLVCSILQFLVYLFFKGCIAKVNF